MPIYKIAIAETHSQYYKVKAKNEDEAVNRAFAYDETKSWAIETWDVGIEAKDHAFTEEIA
tara:strand:+ start:458 stop:640 length:183 start_codon:yes stop_codon:yes gene_type:complete